MTDPVSRVEIDDVLSSIRRLVSENDKAARAAVDIRRDPGTDGVPPAKTNVAQPGKLVLTPAQRVSDGAPKKPDNVVEMSRKPARETAVSGDPGKEPAEDPMDTLGRKIAALEAVIGQTDEQWEPDQPGTDEYAGTPGDPLPWEDAPQPDPSGVQREDRDPAEEAAPDGSAPEDMPILDEDMLREIVSDIVRKELQGALGERITRNVRKMVRREIQMALSAREFD